MRRLIAKVDVGRLKYSLLKEYFIKGTSERIQRVLKPFNIYLSNQSSQCLESQIIKLKDKIPIKEKTDVVYKIHCNDCDRKYIGETGRNLTTRLSEHQRDIRNSKEQSPVFQHVRDNDHNFNFSEPEIIHRSANIFVRRKLEAFYSQ